MTSRTIRIVHFVSLLIAATGLYMCIVVALKRGGHFEAFVVASVVSVIVFSIGWSLLWRPEVSTHRKWRGQAAKTALFSIIIALGLGILVTLATRQEEFALVLASMVYVALFCSGTATAWRETLSERALRIKQTKSIILKCSKCGYDMTGLHEARCPECGTLYTLDELFISALDRSNGNPSYLDD